MENRFGRLINQFKNKQSSPHFSVPHRDSIDTSGGFVYKENSIIIDPSQLPVGGEGYPIRWFGKDARAISDGKGGVDILEDK